MLPPVLYEQGTTNHSICLQQCILFKLDSSMSTILSISSSHSTSTSSTLKSLRRRS